MCTDLVIFFNVFIVLQSLRIRAVAAAIVSALRHLVAVVAAPSDEVPAPADKAPCHSQPRSIRPRASGRVPLANVLPLRCACPLGQHRIPEARVELQKLLRPKSLQNRVFNSAALITAAISAAVWARYPLPTGRGKDTGKAHCIERQKR